MGRILKRCDVCKHFHVVYIVDDPLYPGGKAHYCQHCWKRKFGKQTAESGSSNPATDQAISPSEISKSAKDK